MADLRLQSSFGLHTWNSIRSTDFILSLPDVDPTRVGVTGASGGGTQSMILSAVDPRIAASFPCVMVSTAMQGGCTCENACYLRIGQGNIDIAAATAPRPLGMTAADDWTKELETKGFPDLQALYKTLGKPDNLLATFNIHWKHNYNHVTRTTMYGFMSDHLQLGFKKPVLERDFKVASKEELTVWTAEHPAPSGDKVGEAHEKALLKHWSEDSDKLLTDSVSRSAWEIMINRPLPAPTDIGYDEPAKTPRGDHLLLTSKLRINSANEEVTTHFLFPKENWSGTAYLWLSDKGLESLGGTAAPNATAQALLAKGHAIVIPELYLQGSQTAPRLMDKAKDPNAWGHSACYTYGYNPSLIASRVHDTVTALVYIKNHPKWSVKKLILVGTEGAAPVAAITAAVHSNLLTRAAIDTQGFRFAQVRDQYDPHFIPGAVKYGDLPALLRLTSPLKPAIAGEANAPKALTVETLLQLVD
jgi:dienelactone hydrolase